MTNTLFTCRHTADKVSTTDKVPSDIKSKNVAGADPPLAGIFVVSDLPDPDCAALASNGEYSIADGGVEKYKAYIDNNLSTLVKYSDSRPFWSLVS